jgi:hypothetical protein
MFVIDWRQFYLKAYKTSSLLKFDVWFYEQQFEHYTIRGIGMACTTGVFKNK